MSEPEQAVTDEDKTLLQERLKDPIWRLCNIYKIVDKFGNTIPFVPNPQQREIIDDVYVRGIRRFAILKARQLGLSTLIELIIFDACYWGENMQASIIDRTQIDASEKLVTKIEFAYRALPAGMREPLVSNNRKLIAFQNGSNINAGKNARGGTNQILHVSEWGAVAYEDPERSEEIKTGALPTAEFGLIFVESTFKGGKGGHFYDLLKRAMETTTEQKTSKDFHFKFFPWYLEPLYSLEGNAASIDRSTNKYLDEMQEKCGIVFTPGQRLWYYITKKEQGLFMMREYPTTVDEAFKAPVEGSIYGDIISALRAEGRIINYEYDHTCPIFASWDLGWADSTSVWLWQIVGRDFHVIWHAKREHKTAADMMHELAETQIPITGHFLPHDGDTKNAATGLSYKGAMIAAGAVNIVVVPRTIDIWSGINATRNLLKRAWFRLMQCDTGIAALEAYHTKENSDGKVITKEPVHDWSSHDASALRTAAEAIELGMVRGAAAKKVSSEPRYPDGTVVSLEDVRKSRQRPTQAIFSGPRA